MKMMKKLLAVVCIIGIGVGIHSLFSRRKYW